MNPLPWCPACALQRKQMPGFAHMPVAWVTVCRSSELRTKGVPWLPIPQTTESQPEAAFRPCPSCATDPVLQGALHVSRSHAGPAGRAGPHPVPSSSAPRAGPDGASCWKRPQRVCFSCRSPRPSQLYVCTSCGLGNSVSEASSPVTPALGTRMPAPCIRVSACARVRACVRA